MNRFEKDPEAIKRRAREIDERTTKARSSIDTTTPPSTSSDTFGSSAPPSGLEAPGQKAPADGEDAMRFTLRLTATFTEDDPVGRILAERIRALPEESRKYYSVQKALREAILSDLDHIADKL